MLTQEKAIERVKKLLKMSKSDNENEAALAATKAAKLIEEHQLSEALIRLDDKTAKPEQIIEGARLDGKQDKKRVAWKGFIAYAVADSLGCKMWWDGSEIRCFGRESATQAWNYTCLYLYAEVERHTEVVWAREGRKATAAGYSARRWKNAFRVGAASTISRRLRESVEAAKRERVMAVRKAFDEGQPATPEQQALVLVDKDQQEVESEYTAMEKREKFIKTRSIGTVTSRDGFTAGKEAGERIELNKSRAGLPEGQRHLEG